MFADNLKLNYWFYQMIQGFRQVLLCGVKVSLFTQSMLV